MRHTNAEDKARLEATKWALRLLDLQNRLIVSHEGGTHRIVVGFEVNPAGDLVIWLEE